MIAKYSGGLRNLQTNSSVSFFCPVFTCNDWANYIFSYNFILGKPKKFFCKFIEKGNSTLFVYTKYDTISIFYEFAIFPLTPFKLQIGFLTRFYLSYQLFVCECQFFCSFINLLLKMQLIFFKMSNIFENYCKTLTALIKNNGR